MKKKYSHLIFTVLILVLGLGINASAAGDTQPAELNFNHLWAPTSGQHALFQEWAQRIEKGSQGRVKITLYPGSALSHPVEAWNGLKSGAFDIGSSFANYHRGAFEFYKAQLYFWVGAPSIEFGMREMQRLQKKYPILLQEFEDAKLLWMCAQGPRKLLLAKKPVYKMEDFQGLKLRAPTKAEGELVKSLGGSAPPFVPMGQVYPSLQKAMYDGLWVSTEVLKSFRLAEVISYVANVPLEIGHGKYVAMNWNTWKKLPEDVQNIFVKESAWAAEQDIKLWTKADEEGIEFAKTKNTEFIDFSNDELEKFMAKVRPIQEQTAKAMDEKGYPGSALLKDIRDAIRNSNP